jgi:hypothetical protein
MPTREFEGGSPMVGSRFRWDAKREQLVEEVAITRVANGPEAGPLLEKGVDEAGKERFSAMLHERVTVRHRLEKGKLAAQSAEMHHLVKEGVDLADVAAFYLMGKTAEKPLKDKREAVKVLLAANPKLGFTEANAGEAMRLGAGAEVRIPVEEKGLMKEYGRTGVK